MTNSIKVILHIDLDSRDVHNYDETKVKTVYVKHQHTTLEHEKGNFSLID